jgi:hypothetical protein
VSVAVKLEATMVSSMKQMEIEQMQHERWQVISMVNSL